jgi:hypothetical protein
MMEPNPMRKLLIRKSAEHVVDERFDAAAVEEIITSLCQIADCEGYLRATEEARACLLTQFALLKASQNPPLF